MILLSLISILISLFLILGSGFTNFNHLFNFFYSLIYFIVAGNFLLYYVRKNKIYSITGSYPLIFSGVIIPLLLISASDVLAGSCNYVFGLEDYLLNVGIGIVFYVVLIILINKYIKTKLSYAVLNLYIISSIIFSLLPVIFYHQVYAFHHVIGFFSGPIYERLYVIPDKFLFYRLLTLICILLFIALINYQKTKIFFLVFLLIPLEIVSPFTGIIETEFLIRRSLKGTLKMENLTIIFNHDIPDQLHLKNTLEEIKYRYFEVAEDLNLRYFPEVTVFLFNDPDQKQLFTGNRNVEVSKPWLKAIYMDLKSFSPCVFRHELFHIVLGNFSNNFFKIPFKGILPAMGIVEGMAEGLTDCPYKIEAFKIAKYMLITKTFPDLESLLNPQNFFRIAAVKSYSIYAAFVKYLKLAYGEKKLLELYKTADFKSAFNSDVKSLVKDFKEFLKVSVKLSTKDKKYLHSILSRKSIFQEKCPFECGRLKNRIFSVLAGGKTTRIRDPLERLQKISPKDPNLPYIYASYLFMRKKYDFLKDYSESILEKTENPYLKRNLLNKLATIYVFEGKFQKALTIYDSLMELSYSNLSKHEYALKKFCIKTTSPQLVKKLFYTVSFNKKLEPLYRANPKNPCISLFFALRLYQKGEYKKSNDILYIYQDYILDNLIEEWMYFLSAVNNFYLHDYNLSEFFFNYVYEKTNDEIIKKITRDYLKKIIYYK